MFLLDSRLVARREVAREMFVITLDAPPIAHSDLGDSTKRIQTCSRWVLPTSTSRSVSFSASSRF